VPELAEVQITEHINIPSTAGRPAKPRGDGDVFAAAQRGYRLFAAQTPPARGGYSPPPYCLRVEQKISLTTCSAEGFRLIFAPLKGYDEPEIRLYPLNRSYLIGADAGHGQAPHG
jgi:hypothetical protein